MDVRCKLSVLVHYLLVGGPETDRVPVRVGDRYQKPNQAHGLAVNGQGIEQDVNVFRLMQISQDGLEHLALMINLSLAARYLAARRSDVVKGLRVHSERRPSARRADLLPALAAKHVFTSTMSAALSHGPDGKQRSVCRFRAKPSVRRFLRLESASHPRP